MTKKNGTAKAPSKTEVMTRISEATGLTKKEVSSVFDALTREIERSVGKRGSGQFTIPGLCKITVQHKPASKARKGINPFTGEETMFKAKPARNVIKIRPLKNLKDMAN